MRCPRTTLLVAATLAVACAGNPDKRTLAVLHNVKPDLTEVEVEDGLEQAMDSYEDFLDETPVSSLTPEAMRRLADLKLEKEYGILGDGELVELPAPAARADATEAAATAPERARAAGIADHSESADDFERRAAGEGGLAPSAVDADLELPGQSKGAPAGPLEAIALYDEILTNYPSYPHNDRVLYQKARAYDELGRPDEAIAVIERLVAAYPRSRFIDEVQFRRGEYFFTRKKYFEAEQSYSAVTELGTDSEYYELALYKLGWALYKQDLHEEALHKYIALLDYKVTTGYDFDQSGDQDAERRIADTFRVISLSFSYIGGSDAVAAYFNENGERSYEDRIYSHLGEFYFDKLRYHDAAETYEAFVARYPLHRASPHFGMRVVEIYEAGGFPKLVLESKKEFAATYGLQSEYWRHFAVEDSPEVVSYLKSNLEDLGSHYHALFQEEALADEKPANFREASHWYRAYLASFPEDPDTPAIHYRLADLLLEHEDFGEAAREYERTAYDYPEHERAAAAGYAAIFAHRESQKLASGAASEAARRDAVASTFRFVEAFPEHEHAAVVMGAAIDDLYEMKEFERAIASGHELIDAYPDADLPVRRSAWTVIAHASFDTGSFEQAEQAYERVLEMTSADDDAREAVVENLAAAIYKQGEAASLAEDYRAAADHFLRIRQAAPTSGIRAAAEYDAGAALIRLENWAEAAAVLESFREAYPDHELQREATKQIAFVYREEGDMPRAAAEYERVAAEADDSELQREALLVAGELYEDADVTDRAVAVYLRYVSQFPEPLETAVETRFKVAEIYEATHDEASYHQQLQEIVEIDAAAGDQRTPRVRYLAAQSALVLSEDLFRQFEAVALSQPFEQSLQEKQRRMDVALDAFGRLVEYEVGDVTAAATFYMGEIYSEFSRSLIESERPADFGAVEMQDYELALEEEAFPFEEKAIEVHEKNLELMAAGIYNNWIERSLEKLATLMPGRYAKFEASSGFIRSIDTYAYRAPGARTQDVDESEIDAPVESDESASRADSGLVAPAAFASRTREAAAMGVGNADAR